MYCEHGEQLATTARKVARPALRGMGAALIAWACLAGAARADAVADARVALEMWDPVSVEVRGSSLVVVAKERRVTAKIYEAMIYAGICLWAGTGRVALAGVSEVVILNRHRAAGWVFEGGAGECRRIADAPSSEAKVMILGRTHLYSCTSGLGCKY